MPKAADLLVPAITTLALMACQPPPRGQDDGAAEPTKVEPEPDPHRQAGNAVPRDEADPGETPPPAKGGY